MRLHLFRKQPTERRVLLSLSTSEQVDLVAACLLGISALRADAKLVEEQGAAAVGLGALVGKTGIGIENLGPSFYLLERARELEELKNRILHAEDD